MNNNFYFEILIFFYLIDSKLLKNYNKKYFSEPTILSIFDYVQDFLNDYNVTPTAEQIIEIIKMHGKDDLILPENIKDLWRRSKDYQNLYSKEWIENAAEQFGRYKSFYLGLENTIAYVKSWPSNVGFDELTPYITKARNIFNQTASFSLASAAYHDFFDYQTHEVLPESTHSTGYPFVDQCLSGGFKVGGFYVFMGGPKSGKSMWLINMAANSVKLGYNTVYVTLELQYQLVAHRMAAMMFNVPLEEYEKGNDPNLFEKKCKEFHMSSLKPHGVMQILEYPTSTLTAAKLEADIKKLEEQLQGVYGEDFHIDNVFIDYINIMKDQRGSAPGDTYTKIKDLCEDVRAVMQTNGWAGISVTQTNRQGIDAEDSKVTDVAESAGLLATVDALFGIIRNLAMRANNVYYLKANAMRNSKFQGLRQKFNFNPDTLQITQDATSSPLDEDQPLPVEFRSIENQELQKYKDNIPKQNTITFQANVQQPITGTGLKESEYNFTSMSNPLFVNDPTQLFK